MNLRKFGLYLLANQLLALSLQAVNFSVSPSSVGDNFTGDITLKITGLSVGETVTVRKYLDANGNGVVDASDWLVEQFPLTDGQASVLGGVTNLNVAADTDSIAGQITAKWNLHNSGLEQRFAGKYLFSVSSSGFSAVTLLTITNSANGQSFSGSVESNGVGVPNAAVLVFAGSIGESTFVAGAVADILGNYSVKVPPGTYSLVPVKPGWVSDSGAAASIPLGAGTIVSTNLEMVAGPQTISGRFVDSAVLGPGLGGMLVICSSVDSLLAIGFTDSSGNYSVPVTASQWQVGWESGVLPVLGYVDLLQQPTADTTSGDITGLNVSFPKGTALIHGGLKDGQNHPIAGVSFFADDSSNTYEGVGTTDADGNYVAAVSAGSWYISPDRTEPVLAGYIVSSGTNVTLSPGQTARQDFVALPSTSRISGSVLDVSNNPVANVGVYGYTTINGTTFSQYVDTGTDGSFSFNVATGSWNVGVNCSGSSDSLSALKYECLSEAVLPVSVGMVSTNFIVRPCGQLQVTTPSMLSGGQIGFYYEVLLQGAGCNQPFTWSLAPGSQPLPLGLNLGPDGTLAGYPTNSGAFNFTVRVTDSNTNHVDQPMSLTIAPARIEVLTTSLPVGGMGFAYSQQLSATGGQLPYVWSINPGSDILPPDLILSAGGLISGTPALGATFFFDIRVTDALGSNAVQSFSLLVTNTPLTVIASSLPNASLGAPYSTQLSASGGQPPYSWDLALGSPPLPSGLALTSDGQISGIPDTPGVYNFTTEVTDANSVTVTQALSLLVTQGLTLGAPKWSAGGVFQFQVEGNAGQTYTIEFSADLKSWKTIQTTNAPSSVFTVTVGAAPGKLGFYRVKGP